MLRVAMANGSKEAAGPSVRHASANGQARTETAAKPGNPPGPGLPILTSYDIFEVCIGRAGNLLKIHDAAHGKQGKPERYLADAHRAAIVLAISALDAFVRTFLVDRIRRLLADKSATLPGLLSEQIRKFLKDDQLLEAARKDDLLDRVEKAFQADFERRSFQGTRSIGEIMKLIGHDDIFHEVAKAAKMNEEQLCASLDHFTNRRHVVAHRGDYDLHQRPQKENVVTKRDAQDCIKTVKVVALHISKIG